MKYTEYKYQTEYEKRINRITKAVLLAALVAVSVALGCLLGYERGRTLGIIDGSNASAECMYDGAAFMAGSDGVHCIYD